jgi:hypothetical protein
VLIETYSTVNASVFVCIYKGDCLLLVSTSGKTIEPLCDILIKNMCKNLPKNVRGFSMESERDSMFFFIISCIIKHPIISIFTYNCS